MARITWYQQGYDDAVDGLGFDAPMQPGNKMYENYRAGYEDGQRFLDSQADFDRASQRRR